MGNKFIDRIFNSDEVKYCLSKNNPILHFSGKFAAKEAVKKSLLTSNIIKNIPFKNIQILNNQDGSPYVELKNISISSENILITISHTNEYATAVALIKEI